MRLAVLRTALVVCSLIAALALVETVLRVRGNYRPPNNPITPTRPELYQADSTIGYRLWPSRTTTYHYPLTNPESIPVVSNSDGFRSNREFDERDGRTRILVVGDSFVFGEGVRAEDRFTEQLEALEPRWRVDNMGMTGWGPDLMIRSLERYGPKADPDVVVLAVYTDDFRRLLPYFAGAGYGYPKFELSGTELVTVPYPYPTFWERLRLVQWWYRTRWERNRNRYDLNSALLARFLKDAEVMGFKPVVIYVPGTASSDPEEDERRDFLAKWAASHAVPYRDLTEPIHAAGISNVYITNNFHWNRAGHAVAAAQLQDLLKGVLDGTAAQSAAAR